jgi:hypothetical protein
MRFLEMEYKKKNVFLNSLMVLQDIDDRFILYGDTIQIIDEENQLQTQNAKRKEKDNNYFYNYRYKSINNDIEAINSPLENNFGPQNNILQQMRQQQEVQNPDLFGPKLFFGVNSLYPGQSQNYDINREAFGFFRFKEKEEENNSDKAKNMITKMSHPCFNKGYFDSEMNFIGSGNYAECYNSIQISYSHLGKSKNYEELLAMVQSNSTHSQGDRNFTLGADFKQFNFLFFEKTKQHNNQSNEIYIHKEHLSYENLKSKVKSLCSMQYSKLMAELSKFQLKYLNY